MPPIVNSERTTTTTHHTTTTMITSPKQRYYLGENPYGGSIFGKENKYNQDRDKDLVKQKNHYNNMQNGINGHVSRRQRSEEPNLRWVQLNYLEFINLNDCRCFVWLLVVQLSLSDRTVRKLVSRRVNFPCELLVFSIFLLRVNFQIE